MIKPPMAATRGNSERNAILPANIWAGNLPTPTIEMVAPIFHMKYTKEEYLPATLAEALIMTSYCTSVAAYR